MKNTSFANRFLSLALVLVFGTLASACGGGGSGGGGGTSQLVANFAPDQTGPGSNLMIMGDGPSSGANFTVLVRVSGINDFFGAGFRVQFDDTVAEFVSASGADSFLDDDGAQVFFDTTVLSAGELAVSATIQDPSMPAGVDVAPTETLTLIALNFRATNTTGPSTFDFSNVEVEICPTANAACSNTVPNLDGGSLTATR
jgi:hypothetical protein